MTTDELIKELEIIRNNALVQRLRPTGILLGPCDMLSFERYLQSMQRFGADGGSGDEGFELPYVWKGLQVHMKASGPPELTYSRREASRMALRYPQDEARNANLAQPEPAKEEEELIPCQVCGKLTEHLRRIGEQCVASHPECDATVKDKTPEQSEFDQALARVDSHIDRATMSEGSGMAANACSAIISLAAACVALHAELEQRPTREEWDRECGYTFAKLLDLNAKEIARIAREEIGKAVVERLRRASYHADDGSILYEDWTQDDVNLRIRPGR